MRLLPLEELYFYTTVLFMKFVRNIFLFTFAALLFFPSSFLPGFCSTRHIMIKQGVFQMKSQNVNLLSFSSEEKIDTGIVQ